ncbi:aromatic-ring-hydroxylating dioxygenase subunit beta [Corynebacterium sp.]|uniref:aromatic-ring-hydroxylating dioxygenase subunit beta n=1 Tax=Corynebacterium sp. TaxID=1720 RepID=UPI0028A6477E|nr:aromatic-ring-hydroxylating dioxygenase subunit beta [Corynebacterium sp.]
MTTQTTQTPDSVVRPISPFLSDARVQRAIELIWYEAALLDRKDYPAWEKQFTEDGYYIVPVDPETEDFENSLNMIYDDARMRHLRVERLIQGFSPSAVAAATTVRTVSRFEVLELSDNEVVVRSAQIITAHKRNETRNLGAELTHRIRLAPDSDGDTDLIIQKVARLIDSQDAIGAAGFLI